MKTFYKTCSTGSVVLALLGCAVSTAEANVYTNRQVVVEGYWNGAFDDFYSTPPTPPTKAGEIGYGSLWQQPQIVFAPLMQVNELGDYNPLKYIVVTETGYPKKETIGMDLGYVGKKSQNQWEAVRLGSSDIFQWQVMTNIAPIPTGTFDFSYLRTTTTAQYRLDPVPEPTAVAVLGLGLAAFAWFRRR